MRLLSPQGKEITGTLDIVPGRAEIDPESFKRDENGTLVYKLAGETDMFWDDQRPRTERGFDVYVDANGNEWPEDQLTLVDEHGATVPFTPNRQAGEGHRAIVYDSDGTMELVTSDGDKSQLFCINLDVSDPDFDIVQVPMHGGGTFAARVYTLKANGIALMIDFQALAKVMQDRANIVFLRTDDGFWCGDKNSGRTSYAYPTSDNWVAAEHKPRETARDMLQREPATRIAEYDDRNWLKLKAVV